MRPFLASEEERRLGEGTYKRLPCFLPFPRRGGGQVIGESDNIAAYPAKNPFYPADMGATILHTLGIDPHVEITDPEGRPLRANNGSVITSLF